MSARSGVRDYRRRFEAAIGDALDDVALEVVEVAKGIISSEAIDTGSLLRSDEIRAPTPRSRVIAFTANHSVYVHFGAEPHWPPYEPIRDWVKRNLSITPTGAELKAGVGEGKPPGEAAVERVARAVQASIAKKGTPAVPYLSRAVDRVRPRIATVMREVIDRRTQ